MVEKKIALPGFHPLRFFSKLSDEEKNTAYFTSGDWNIICWNPHRTISGSDASVFETLKKLPMKKSRLPFAGGTIGYCSYDFGCALQGVRSRHRSGIPQAIFHVYDCAVLWKSGDVFIVGEPEFEREVRMIHARPFVSPALPKILWEPTLPKNRYRSVFSTVMRGIRNGDFYQLNLSYPFTALSDVHGRKLFAALAEMHPAPCASYIEHEETAILSLSPERFVTIENGVITTCPIKGTRPRGKTSVADKRLADELLASPKEAAELSMITDLLRNDVGKVSAPGSVTVLEHRTLQKNPSVWHTYSVIRGMLQKNLHPIDAFASMFPGGSVTGCPKVAAMKEIDRLEDRPRGAYCGSMLMLGRSGFLDSTILIRTIEKRKKALTLGMGGGIVADSVCAQEYDETRRKAQPFVDFSRMYSPRYFRGQREISSETIAALFDPAHPGSIGIFETMRVDTGRIRDLSAHLTRLRHSAELRKIHIPSVSVLAKNLRFAVKKNSANILRVKIVCTPRDVIIEMRPLIRDPASRYGIAATVKALDRALPQAKSLPYHHEYKAHTEAQRQGYGEALLRRSDGSVQEGAYSNIFFVKNGTLWTSNEDILPGITRAAVLRIARRLNIPVRFVSLQESEIFHADEIFLTSSLAGITPVLRVDTVTIGDGSPGKLTKRIQNAFEATFR